MGSTLTQTSSPLGQRCWASAVASPRTHFWTKTFVFSSRQAVREVAPALSHLPWLTSGPSHLIFIIASLAGKSRQRCRIFPGSLLDQALRFRHPTDCLGSRASAVASSRAHFWNEAFVFDTCQAVWEVAPALSHLPGLTSGSRHSFWGPGTLSGKSRQRSRISPGSLPDQAVRF